MKITGVATGAAVLALGLALTGCGSLSGERSDAEGATRSSEAQALIGGDVIAPVTLPASDLAGQTVDLKVGQVLRIDTANLDVASYRAAISDSEVAAFAQGYRDDGAEFSPGITGESAGSADITLTHEQGGLEPIQFTVRVTK